MNAAEARATVAPSAPPHSSSTPRQQQHEATLARWRDRRRRRKERALPGRRSGCPASATAFSPAPPGKPPSGHSGGRGGDGDDRDGEGDDGDERWSELKLDCGDWPDMYLCRAYLLGFTDVKVGKVIESWRQEELDWYVVPPAGMSFAHANRNLAAWMLLNSDKPPEEWTWPASRSVRDGSPPLARASLCPPQAPSDKAVA